MSNPISSSGPLAPWAPQLTPTIPITCGSPRQIGTLSLCSPSTRPTRRPHRTTSLCLFGSLADATRTSCLSPSTPGANCSQMHSLPVSLAILHLRGSTVVRASSNVFGPASYRIRCKCSICFWMHCSVALGVDKGPSVKVPVSSLALNMPEMGHLVLKKPCGGCHTRCGTLQRCTVYDEVWAGG